MITAHEIYAYLMYIASDLWWSHHALLCFSIPAFLLLWQDHSNLVLLPCLLQFLTSFTQQNVLHWKNLEIFWKKLKVTISKMYQCTLWIPKKVICWSFFIYLTRKPFKNFGKCWKGLWPPSSWYHLSEEELHVGSILVACCDIPLCMDLAEIQNFISIFFKI